jgi:hypothetical protein
MSVSNERQILQRSNWTGSSKSDRHSDGLPMTNRKEVVIRTFETTRQGRPNGVRVTER